MISAKREKPDKDGRRQEHYKKQNKTKTKNPIARHEWHVWSGL